MSTSTRRWVGCSGVSLAILLGLSACNPVDDRLWPSTRPPSASRPVAAEPAPFFRPLPGNIWEWSGVFSLLLGAGAVGLAYWRFPGLREEFASLRDQTRRLHERRDRSTADLAHMARTLRDLEQEITGLRRELARRDSQPPPPLSPPVAPPAPITASLPLSPSIPLSGSTPLSGTTPELPHLSPPSPPGRSRPRAIPQSSPPSSFSPPPPPLASPAVPEPDGIPPLQVEPVLSPAPVSLLPERPDSVSAPDPEPTAVVQNDGSPERWGPQPGPGLEALIVAINSRGRAPIEGVTCVELDLAPPPEDEGLHFGSLSPRLRMVARGGRFLLVMVEGDAWLFPSIETLDRVVDVAIEPSIFQALPDAVDRAQLIQPAMLRDVGGLWEVTDPGKLLVPKR